MGYIDTNIRPVTFDERYGGVISLLDNQSLLGVLKDRVFQTKYVSFCPRDLRDPKPEDVVIVVAAWVHENISHYYLLSAMERATGLQYVPIDGGLLERLPNGRGIGIFGDSHLHGQTDNGRKLTNLTHDTSRDLTIDAIRYLARKAEIDISIAGAEAHRRNPGW